MKTLNQYFKIVFYAIILSFSTIALTNAQVYHFEGSPPSGEVGQLRARRITIHSQNNSVHGYGNGLRFNNISDYAIYTAFAGTHKAIDGGNTHKSGRVNMAMRFRVYKASDAGFIFENAHQDVLASINGFDGLARFKAINVSGKTNLNEMFVRGKATFNQLGVYNNSITLKRGRNGDPSILLHDGTQRWKRISSDASLAFWANGKGREGANGDDAPQLILSRNGNVGIGTRAPTKKLDVAGDIHLSGDLYKDGELYSPTVKNSNDFTGDLYIRNRNDIGIRFVPEEGGSLKLMYHKTTDGKDNLIGFTDTHGKYMAHSNNTTKDFHVAGNTYTNRLYLENTLGNSKNKLRINGHANNLSLIAGGGVGASATKIAFETATANSPASLRAIITSEGRMGIGIENPTKMLDVAGDININGTLSYTNDNVRVGTNAGKDVVAEGAHVFIGKGAGSKASFDKITVIDYEDDANTNPVTGNEYLTKHSVFVVNNHEDLEKPLLFGNFAKEGDADSMARLAINTHHVVDEAALTISGAVHIGPKNMDPTTFPSKKGYDDALLWVEKGIVTENVVYAFTSDWNDWPDYVFDKDYDLMGLDDLEKYIRKEKHLPGIAPIDQIKKEGLKSRETIAKLLLKIEELTLYTIDQEKKIESQNKLNQTLLDRLGAIENKLNNLTP